MNSSTYRPTKCKELLIRKFLCIKFLCVNFFRAPVGRLKENLTHVQLFNTCVNGERGGAVKTLLHLRLPYVYGAVWEAVIGEELAREREPPQRMRLSCHSC